jgi:hypothetical protein
MFRKIFLILLLCTLVNSCSFLNNSTREAKLDLKRVDAIYYTEQSDYFFASYQKLAFPDTTFVIKEYEDSFVLPKDKSLNIIYENIDPYKTFIFAKIQESSILFKGLDPYKTVDIYFEKLCDTYIVAHPTLTNVFVNPKLQYEQIIWTPRFEGTWQVTIGTEDRGCKPVNKVFIQKARTKEYEQMIDRLKLK